MSGESRFKVCVYCGGWTSYPPGSTRRKTGLCKPCHEVTKHALFTCTECGSKRCGEHDAVCRRCLHANPERFHVPVTVIS